MELATFLLLRHLRNARDSLLYPFWILRGRHPPDNPVRKRRRIAAIAKEFACETLVETGTFYGQTAAAMESVFSEVFTCELSPHLFELNRRSFMHVSNLHILQGDSAIVLKEILTKAPGRILFWLDGHYSGPGTAIGDSVSPVMAELDAICRQERKDHCILVDDAQLFTGLAGYPTLEALRAKILEINPQYRVWIDGDCIVAVPESK